jgi:hypothetical protein
MEAPRRSWAWLGLGLVQLTALLGRFGGEDGLIGFSVGCYKLVSQPAAVIRSR